MGQFPIDDHPYPFMLCQQNSATMQTPPPSASRDDLFPGESSSRFGFANHVQDLASHIGALSLSNPCNIYTDQTAGGSLYSGHRNQGTNNIIDEAALSRIRIAIAAQAAARTRVQGLYYDIARPHQSTEPKRRPLFVEAKDPCGCRWLRRKIDEGTRDEINVIIFELKDHLHDLLKDPFGSSVVLEFFQTTNCSMVQVNYVCCLITNDVQMLKDVCIEEQGSRVIQKILENVRTRNLLCMFTNALRRIAVALMKNINGGYVIQQHLNLFPPGHKRVILDEVARNCLDIASDRYGCCIIQKCLNVAAREDGTASPLVSEIVSNAGQLAADPYGNYVIQFLAKLKLASVNARIVAQLSDNFVVLSTNKFASNVVEKLLHHSEATDVAIIVSELMQSPEFLNVLQDPYGNFVAQKAVEYSEGDLHQSFSNAILSMSEHLQSHIYGKRVFQFTRLYEAS